jgi:hypothetical protein
MAEGSKRQRPGNAWEESARMKLHLRPVRLGGTTYRLLTLRPGTRAAFSTNSFHGTWHILTDICGARLLARLLWGLAYQRQPGTVIAIHGEHLQPTPFDADPSQPVLLANALLTPLDGDAGRGLKARLRTLGAPGQTVRWQTPGLDAVLAEARWYQRAEFQALWRPAGRQRWAQERFRHLGGCLCYSAPPAVLRYQARWIHGMDPGPCPSTYHYLAAGRDGHHGDGEVQIFRRYRADLAVADLARREVLARGPAPDPETLREAVWAQCDAVRQRRRSPRQRKTAGGKAPPGGLTLSHKDRTD